MAEVDTPEERVEAFLAEVEQRRISVQNELDATNQDHHGQHFTPMRAARIIASQAKTPHVQNIRILDPGAGVGSLTAALVGRLLVECCGKTITITAIELDPAVVPHLKATLEECVAIGEALGSTVRFDILEGDLLDLATGFNRMVRPLDCQFDAVIMNPPYYKLDKATRDWLAADSLDTPNIYATFLAIAAHALCEGGQVVAITPRSFANGAYFRSFRQRFFGTMALDRIHQFDSRGIFSDTGVLQETVIFSATKEGSRESVTVTFSHSADKLLTEHTVPYTDVIDPDDSDVRVRIPTSAADGKTAAFFDVLPATGADLGIMVSTGKVVDFRARPHGYLLPDPTDGTVPMITVSNLRGGHVVWPLVGHKKEQALMSSDKTRHLRVPGERFVLVKRFSAREEPRRVVAAVYEPDEMPDGDVGLDNKLNYIHTGGHGLDRDVAWGLCLWLNSSLVDDHFRTLSGNTQVNAGDLNRLRYPSHESLTDLGASFGGGPLPDQNEIDALVRKCIMGGHSETDERTFVSTPDAQNKVAEARALLEQLGFDAERRNERSALILLALLRQTPSSRWADAEAPMLRTVEIIQFIAQQYGVIYQPNTRETIRRRTLHQFVEALLVVQNADEPLRAVNSPKWNYQLHPDAVKLIRQWGTKSFADAATAYSASRPGLIVKYAAAREMDRIPITMPDGSEITLSPGGQNVLIKAMIEEFGGYYLPGGQLIYVGDADSKLARFAEGKLAELGVTVDHHGKLPDLIVYLPDKNWLVLMEAASSHGPVDAKRHGELAELLARCTAGLVYVSAFPSRAEMRRYLPEIAWETEVWCAEDPTHLIHFNGERFLGPYD